MSVGADTETTASGAHELPSFTELYRSLAQNRTEMNMSIERTFSCESTDTASEMMYDSFDRDNFLSSESFDMDENCFLDDITEEDITACFGNDQVQSFEYIFWFKKLAGTMGKEFGKDAGDELETLLSAIEYIKYLKWSLGMSRVLASPHSVCSFSSIEQDLSPEVTVSADLNATFRRKLSFGDDMTKEVRQQVSSVLPNIYQAHVTIPTEAPYDYVWGPDDESQNTVLGYKDASLLEMKQTNHTETANDMSFCEDNGINNQRKDDANNLYCNEDANMSFLDQNYRNINSGIYESLKQLCLVREDNSKCTCTNTAYDTSNSCNEGPTEEDLIQHYFRQYPTLSSLLIDYTSDESDEPSVRRRKPKPRVKRKAKRRVSQKKDTTEDAADTQIAEADSTTYSAGNKKHQRTNKTPKTSKKSNGLKRPKNGFIRFSIEYRKELAEKHPNLDNRDVSKMLGQKWRKMNPEERKPYEEEFANDLEEMKKQNPTWKYASDKRSGIDDIETMPSRLRPRDKLKRKFSPYIIKALSAKKRRLSPRVKSKVSRRGAIMKCRICSKYQQIYGVPTKNLTNLRSLWFCGLNPDPKNNVCLARPPMTIGQCTPLSSPAMIRTCGPFSSVVPRSSCLERPPLVPRPMFEPQRFTHSSRHSLRPFDEPQSERAGNSTQKVKIVAPVRPMENNYCTNTSTPISNKPSFLSRTYASNSKKNTSTNKVNDSKSQTKSPQPKRAATPYVSLGNALTPPKTENTVSSCNVPKILSLPISSTAAMTTENQNVNPLVPVSTAPHDFFNDFKAFISIIPTPLPTKVAQPNTTQIPSANDTSALIPSTVVDMSTEPSGNVPTANAYLTVIPKSIWNNLSAEAMGLMFTQANAKQQ